MVLLTYLRCSKSLTKTELSKETGLTLNDISRFEKRRLPGMDKVVVLARYFSVTVDALLTNNFKEVFQSFRAPMTPSHKLSRKFDESALRNSKTGREGEDFVFRKECEKLRGTAFENAVNPNFANDPDSGFDILSFSLDGEPIFIEVKATTDTNQSFEMTEREIEKLNECIHDGARYELHRVYKAGTPHARREIISGEELITGYDRKPQVSYRFSPKKVKK